MEFPVQLAIDNSRRPIRLLQITDCHLGEQVGEQLLGLDTDESLADVLSLVQREQAEADFLLVTGDIANNGIASSYTRFLDTLGRYLNTPMAWLPGNHDNPAVMAEVLAERSAVKGSQAQGSTLAMEQVIEMGSWQLILLDSSVPGYEHGDLADSQLQLLENALTARPDLHALVLLHHQPVAVGSAWVDQYVVRNADAFFAVLERYPQVKGVCWGHVHQEFAGERNGLKLWASPSSCVQFKPNNDDFTVDHAMPGYRWFDLYENGRIDTGLSRVADKAYSIDYASLGY